MIKQITFILSMLLLSFPVIAQEPIDDKDLLNKNERANYLNGNIEKQLYKNIKYPVIAASNNINGEVVVELTITKEGFAKDLKLLKYDNESLMAEAHRVVKKLNGSWAPTIENDVAVDKTYIIVFQFMMADFNPIKYTITRAEKLITKKKFDKALKTCNNSLKDWAYEPKLYQLRAKINACLNDIEASTADQLYSIAIRDQMLTNIIFIQAYGVKKAPRVIETRIERVN